MPFNQNPPLDGDGFYTLIGGDEGVQALGRVQALSSLLVHPNPHTYLECDGTAGT